MISPLSISILIISLLIFFTDPYFSNRVLSKDRTELNEPNHSAESQTESESEDQDEEENEDIQ